MENKRQDQCSCGSKLRYLEIINGHFWVICGGSGCKKEWRAKRKDDISLQKFNEVKDEFHS